MTMQLETACVRTLPVTALQVVDEFVLAASGPCLEVLSIRASVKTIYYSRQIFASQTIHGIHAYRCEARDRVSWLILVWGGRHVRALSARVVPGFQLELSAMSESATCDDWVLDLRVTPFLCQDVALDSNEFTHSTAENCSRETTYLALALTAHNALVAISIIITDTQRTFLKLESMTTPANTVMFSGKMHFASTDFVLVGAGSSFGEVSLWSCKCTHNSIATKCLVSDEHLFFPAHDGSIYGLDILIVSEEVALLVTCSDDRTVRVWNIAHYLENSGLLNKSRKYVLDHQTSSLAATWGRNPEVKIDGSLPLLTTAWAHTSRIWDVHIADRPQQVVAERSNDNNSLNELDDLHLDICTHGEDATIQLWRLKAERVTISPMIYLNHVRTVSAHAGKNVWSVSVEPNQDLLISGGADGDICSIPGLLPCLPTQNSSPIDNTWNLKNQAIQFPGLESSEAFFYLTSDVFRSFSFLQDGAFLAVTRNGYVLMAEKVLRSVNLPPASSQPTYSWQLLGKRDDLASHSAIVTLPTRRGFSDPIGFLAGASGQVFCFAHGRLSLKPCIDVSAKVPVMFVQSITTSDDTVLVALLIPRLGSSNAVFVLFEYQLSTTTEPTSDFVESHQCVDLVLPNGFVVTSMLYFIAYGNDHLFLGARNGRIIRLSRVRDFMYKSKDKVTKHWLEMQGISTSPHKDAVSALLMHEQESLNSKCFASISRDSTVAIHTLDLELLHQLKSPFGDNIEGAYLDNGNSKIYQYGFQGENFAVQDTAIHRNIMHIECGGANRIWSFLHPDMNGCEARASLLWTRKGNLNLRTERARDQLTMRRGGGHGREAKACAATRVSSSTQGHCNHWLVASGAEDTDIRIFKIVIPKTARSQTLPTVQCRAIIHKHNTGIQHLQWSRNGQRLFSSAGSEEFYVWRVRQNVEFVDVGVICESTLPRHGNRFDLRITHFEAHEQGRESTYQITMCLSDSTWRIYEYCTEHTTARWTQLMSGLYTNNCLTRLTYLRPSLITSLSAPDVLCTASSNGHLTLSSIHPAEHSVLSTKRIHQSSVSCLSTVPLSSRQASSQQSNIVLSTSDDNSIAISRINLELVEITPKLPVSYCSSPDLVEAVTASDTKQEEKASPIFRSNERSSWCLKSWSVLRVPRAHAASITALAIIHRSSSLKQDLDTTLPRSASTPTTSEASVYERRILTIIFVTSGPDQRLKRWHLTVDTAGEGTDSLQLRRTGNFPTSVADLGALCALGYYDGKAVENEEEHAKMRDEQDDAIIEDEPEQRQMIVVCGVGMEVRDVT